MILYNTVFHMPKKMPQIFGIFLASSVLMIVGLCYVH